MNVNLLQPLCLQDFWDNEIAIDHIRTFLTSDNKTCIIVVGQTGCGKTTFCQLACKEFANKYVVSKPTYENFTTHKEFISFVDNFLKTQSIEELMCKKKKVLFLDDVEVLFSTNRYANSYIQDLLLSMSASNNKVIITCSKSLEKKLTELKKKHDIIYIQNPKHNTLLEYLKTHICPNKYVDDELARFINEMGCNYRNIMMNVHALANTSNNKNAVINSVTFDQSVSDITFNIIKAPQHTCKIKDMEIWISNDPTLLSYMLYDNLVKKYCKTNLKHILHTYSCASVLENVVYLRNDWFLSDICNLWRTSTLKLYADEGHESKIKRESIQYTNTPIRSSGYFYNVKKNNIAVTDLYLSRNDALLISEYNVKKPDSSTSVFIKKIMNL
jgi:guanylate kinase